MTQRRADLLLFAIYAGWGMSFLFMKLGLRGIGPFNLIALRFGIAFFVTALLFRSRIRRFQPLLLRYSAVLGLILFLIFTALLYGLKTTTASAAGFLASTTVVIVPILRALMTRRLPPKPIAWGVLIAISGIALLTIGESFSMEFGAVLCLLGALCYAVYIIATDYFVRRVDALQLGVVHLAFAATIALVFSFAFESPKLPGNTSEWVAVLGLALVCSAFGFVMQPVAQQYTTPERTGLLYATEPLCSAFFGYAFLHETLPARAYLGAALVIISVLISSTKPGNNDEGTTAAQTDNQKERGKTHSAPTD